MKRFMLSLQSQAIALALIAVVGCATQAAIKADSHNYQAIAVASCTDLTNVTTAAVVAATAIQMELKDPTAYATKLGPIVADVQAAVKVYCDATQLVATSADWSAILSQQNTILKLVSDINALIASIKNTPPKALPAA